MALEMNVFNGYFYKREMFQPKDHWTEIKYLGAIQNPRRQLFADVIMLFLNIFALAIAACRRELKETPIEVFSSEYNEIFKSTYFEEHLWAAAFDSHSMEWLYSYSM